MAYFLKIGHTAADLRKVEVNSCYVGVSGSFLNVFKNVIQSNRIARFESRKIEILKRIFGTAITHRNRKVGNQNRVGLQFHFIIFRHGNHCRYHPNEDKQKDQKGE